MNKEVVKEVPPMDKKVVDVQPVNKEVVDVAPMDKEVVLEVKDLGITFFTDRGELPAVQNVDFKIHRGETLAVVGESGCGKSMTALSIMRLIPSPPGKITSGEILYKGNDLNKLSENEICKIRGNEISMIFQEPMTSLNPVMTTGKQIMETIMVHNKITKKEAAKKALDIIKSVGISMPEKVYSSYPHELSGGMRQRIMIAMALVCRPDLLICDEPTTALDVTIQAQILKLIDDMKRELNSSVMIITHDMGVVSEMADYVMVMYAGKVVEYSKVNTLFEKPLHPYTEGLIKSIPKLDENVDVLETIDGSVPMLYELPEGCFFSPRCKYAKEICHKNSPGTIAIGENHTVCCFKYTKEWEE